MRDQFFDLSDSEIDEIQDMIDDDNENEFQEVCLMFIKIIFRAGSFTKMFNYFHLNSQNVLDSSNLRKNNQMAPINEMECNDSNNVKACTSDENQIRIEQPAENCSHQLNDEVWSAAQVL